MVSVAAAARHDLDPQGICTTGSRQDFTLDGIPVTDERSNDRDIATSLAAGSMIPDDRHRRTA